MITKYFCARHWASTGITREDFAKVNKGFGTYVRGRTKALQTNDFTSFDTWEEAHSHLLKNCAREMTNAKHMIEQLKRMKDPSK